VRTDRQPRPSAPGCRGTVQRTAARPPRLRGTRRPPRRRWPHCGERAGGGDRARQELPPRVRSGEGGVEWLPAWWPRMPGGRQLDPAPPRRRSSPGWPVAGRPGGRWRPRPPPRVRTTERRPGGPRPPPCRSGPPAPRPPARRRAAADPTPHPDPPPPAGRGPPRGLALRRGRSPATLILPVDVAPP